MRVWHDNSGKRGAASWFLKFIIVHDLQTRARSYFICNRWLALDKDDGNIDRILPVAGDKQKTETKYLMEKQTKAKLTDNHLWLSVFTKPANNSFTRKDRLTCCFTLLYATMLMNIMYYGQDSSPSSIGLTLGPFKISSTQVNIYFQ
jgi:polycystin 1L2